MFLQQLVTGISVGGIYALLATGYSLIYSLLDFSNWAHGEFAMVSAYIAIVLSSFMGMPFVLAAVGGMAGGALVSFLCERFAYRRIESIRMPAYRAKPPIDWLANRSRAFTAVHAAIAHKPLLQRRETLARSSSKHTAWPTFTIRPR